MRLTFFFLILLLLCACLGPIDKEFEAIESKRISVTNKSFQNISKDESIKVIQPELPYVNVKDFGAHGDGLIDDTRAIQSAINNLTEGDILFFPKGTYKYSDIITIENINITLLSNHSTLLATSDRQALWIKANHTKIIGFDLISDFEDTRQGDPAFSHIVLDWAHDTEIRNNYISGGRETGIIAFNSHYYKIVNNSIADTKADSIHNTEGSSNALIVNNTIIRSGDDGIAVVSYVPYEKLCQNIQIIGNQVINNKGGRGISVVGGEHIRILDNHIESTTAAGIIIASEKSYNTYGNKHITIRNNEIHEANYDKSIDHSAIFLIGRSGNAKLKGKFISIINENITIDSNLIKDTIGGPAHIRYVGSDGKNVSFINNQIYGDKDTFSIQLDQNDYILSNNIHNN
jgi:polygalacturonase